MQRLGVPFVAVHREKVAAIDMDPAGHSAQRIDDRVNDVGAERSQLSIPIGVLWNSQHRQPRCADEFNATLAAHMQSVMAKFDAGRDDSTQRARRPAKRG